MSRLRMASFVWCVAAAAALVPTVSDAQYMINMSLVTCSQYLALPPDQSRIFSAWMSGWFNQKTGYTYINLQAYARNVAKRQSVVRCKSGRTGYDRSATCHREVSAHGHWSTRSGYAS